VLVGSRLGCGRVKPSSLGICRSHTGIRGRVAAVAPALSINEKICFRGDRDGSMSSSTRAPRHHRPCDAKDLAWRVWLLTHRANATVILRLLSGDVSEATPRGTTRVSTALLSRGIRRYSQRVVDPTVGRTALGNAVPS
jgi:hypothetical protein